MNKQVYAKILKCPYPRLREAVVGKVFPLVEISDDNGKVYHYILCKEDLKVNTLMDTYRFLSTEVQMVRVPKAGELWKWWATKPNRDYDNQVMLDHVVGFEEGIVFHYKLSLHGARGILIQTPIDTFLKQFVREV